MKIPSPDYRLSNNSIPYVRWGEGPKTMVIFPGGPGNTLPRGFGFRMMGKPFAPFLDNYTLFMAGRKRGLSDGYTTRQMSADYAELFNELFGGPADVVVGTSFGGMIAQYFAADYPHLFGHIVIAMAAFTMSETGKQVDIDYARYISEGRAGAAMARILDALMSPSLGRSLMKPLFRTMGGFMNRDEYEGYRKDIIIEGEAEASHDASDAIVTIDAPVLIIGGTADIYFPQPLIEETHHRIKNSVLTLYEGKGHMSVMTDKRFPQDIMEFVQSAVAG